MKKRPSKLALRPDAIRTLAGDQLDLVAAGCDTTSYTTEGVHVPTSGITGCCR